MVNDLIADLITRIRNGQQSSLLEVPLLNSKFSRKFLDILIEQGFIRGYHNSSTNFKELIVYLKYHNGQPVIKKIKKISTKSKPIYCGLAELWRLDHGHGFYIVSTSSGLMVDEKARFLRMGGEIIAYIE